MSLLTIRWHQLTIKLALLHARINEFDSVDDEESVGEDTTGLPPDDDDLEDIDFLCHMEEDILHGYLPDSTYNPVNMEQDGVYP